MLNVKRCITGAKCYKNRVDDFVYKPIGIPSYLRLGISDFYNELSDAKAHEIEYIVRPKDSYPSGGYGVIYSITCENTRMFLRSSLNNRAMVGTT